MKTYTRAVCRGSWVLGTACGRCERCNDTLASLKSAACAKPDLAPPEEVKPPERLFADAGIDPAIDAAAREVLKAAIASSAPDLWGDQITDRLFDLRMAADRYARSLSGSGNPP